MIDLPSDTLLVDEHTRDLVHSAEYLVGRYSWVMATLITVLLFRGIIEQFIAVMVWKIGRRYNEGKTVVVNGFFCRIVKIGLFYVEFYAYNQINEPPKRGWSWLVPGDRLNKLDIWIPLAKHEVDEESVQTVSHTKHKE